MQDFASQLRALREAAGLTQEELAERAGVTSYAVSALERGRRQRPYPHTVRSLADALGASDEQRSRLLASVPRRGAVPAEDRAAVDAASLSVLQQAARPVQLPAPATGLCGRDREVDALRDLLLGEGRRLVTLTGTGGQALLSRLDDAMVRAGGPDLPARQRTLRATFDWSYDLLAPAEQRLLRVLSVFHGGCTLDAVEDVSAATGETEPVLPLLEVLVEQSLVVVSTGVDGETRFGLLEPVAQYARSRQDQSERIAVRRAHAACYLAFAERAAPEYQTADQVAWLDRSEREDANLSAALASSLESDDGETAGRLCWSLWLFWWLRGRLLPGRRSAEAALTLDQSPEARALTASTAAATAFALGDLEMADARWREAEALALAGEDEYVKGGAVAGVGLVALARGELDVAEDCFVRSLPYTEGQGGYGDWLRSLVHVWLGTVHLVRGDLRSALQPMRHGLESARRRGDRLTSYVALYNLSQVAVALGDHATARQHVHEGMRLTQETGDLANLFYLLEALAVVEGATGEPHRVAVLLGAADAVRELTGGQVYGYYKPDEALRASAADVARDLLGEDVYGDSVDAGRGLTPDEAITYALTGTAETGSAATSAAGSVRVVYGD